MTAEMNFDDCFTD